ncbi:MAG: hypothetical protein KDA85_18280 [Planctomycetaceae bacterium]|nr:hypothetical protein [Planctomycetaceae bacterium]
MSETTSDLVVTDRRRSGRRRLTEANRLASEADAEEVRLRNERREIIDRRRQDRRRQIDPTTCERDYSEAEVEFMRAMDDYKRRSGRPFPTWSEVLEVMFSLGYRKVAEASQMEWRTFGDGSNNNS